jgi:predicted MFS family arabinose efflux permease
LNGLEVALSAAFSRGYRAWMLTVLMLVNALQLADRQGLAASAQAIKVDLKFTDSEMGMLLGLGFAIFYTLLGLPLARMAEHMGRTKIIAGSLAIFGVMAALCASAQGFWRFLLFRIGVGVGDAGFGPPVASLVGDHYPMQKRASAMSIIWLGAPIGVVGGSYFGGWMAEHWSWRVAFATIGTAGVSIALLAILTLREPTRGMSDPVRTFSARPPSTWVVLKFLLAKRSMVHVLIGCGLAAVPMNAIGQFLGPFLVRTFHVGYAEQGRLLSVIAFAGMSAGLLLGGFGVDWAARFDKRWYVWGPAITLALSAPLFVLGFNQPALAGTVAVLMAAHVVLFPYFTATLAIAQNMVTANMRASSAFAVALVIGLVGIGLGPTLMGFLSDAFATRAFSSGDYRAMCPGGAPMADTAQLIVDACAHASATGIRYALVAMSLLLIWAGIHYFLAARSFKRDLETQFVPVRS